MKLRLNEVISVDFMQLILVSLQEEEIRTQTCTGEDGVKAQGGHL